MSSNDIEVVEQICIQAGQEILDVYNSESAPKVTIKGDNSPLTEADRRANALIVEQLLRRFPDIPILSEESESIDYSIRQNWSKYWLVDPLDGTKEFINRNGEFTVNIALIEQGTPVLGVVHVPVQGVTYSGQSGGGASKLHGDGRRETICVSRVNSDVAARVVASRSHRDQKVDRLLAEIATHMSEPSVVSMGSSLKMCLVAEGSADIYPRFAPTCEWDTGAAHAVLLAAGGQIVELDFSPLHYNQKAELLNPHFIAIGDMSFDWQALADRALN